MLMRAVVRVALKGVWLCMKYEIPQMLMRWGNRCVQRSLSGSDYRETGRQPHEALTCESEDQGLCGMRPSKARRCPRLFLGAADGQECGKNADAYAPTLPETASMNFNPASYAFF